MPGNNNNLLVHRFVDSVNDRRFDDMQALLTEDFSIPPGKPGLTRDSLKAVLEYYVAAFPDLHYTIVDQADGANAHFVHLRMEGEHRGDYQGHQGSGRKFSVDEIEVMVIRDGKIAGYTIVWDETGFRTQLGI